MLYVLMIIVVCWWLLVVLVLVLVVCLGKEEIVVLVLVVVFSVVVLVVLVVVVKVQLMGIEQLCELVSQVLCENCMYVLVGDNVIEYYFVLCDKMLDDVLVKSVLIDLLLYILIVVEQYLGCEDYIEVQCLVVLIEKVDVFVLVLLCLKDGLVKGVQNVVKCIEVEVEKVKKDVEDCSKQQIEQQCLVEQCVKEVDVVKQIVVQQDVVCCDNECQEVECQVVVCCEVEQKQQQVVVQQVIVVCQVVVLVVVVVLNLCLVSILVLCYLFEVLCVGIFGEVLVEIIVGIDGLVINVCVLCVMLLCVFDCEVMNVVKCWCFELVSVLVIICCILVFVLGGS